MASKIFAQLARFLQKNKPDSGQLPAGARAMFGIGSLVNNRYRLDAEIGRGGMGIVYRAHDLTTDRDVAIKVINLDQANALTRQQFSREAEITRQLSHPHIVNVYETGVVDSGGRELSPYIAMELVQGCGLDSMRGLTYARIIDLGKQICQALDYAHAQGFVHRDLKPGNVLVEKNGFEYCAKLVDFGLARSRGADNLPAESNTAGTIYYLAPEVIAGQPADVSSDLYALGAMLYELITGRVPFSDFIDDQAILSQHLTEAVAPPSHSRSDVPPALERIVLRLLEKDPAKRFATAREVYQALEQISLSAGSDLARGNLPAISNDLAFDEHEVAQLQALLAANSLVTLPADAGTFALFAGARLGKYFPDGIWWVDLRLVNAPALVLPAVVGVLGLQLDPNRPQAVALIENLHQKHLLLLFDHCGHVREACAQCIETILRTCPEVRILATSDQPLNLPAEKLFPAL